MGIAGLLPMLKDIQRPIHVKEWSGKTLAVDAYVRTVARLRAGAGMNRGWVRCAGLGLARAAERVERSQRGQQATRAISCRS